MPDRVSLTCVPASVIIGNDVFPAFLLPAGVCRATQGKLLSLRVFREHACLFVPLLLTVNPR